MKNDMDQSHPDQRFPGGKPLPKGMDNNRCRQCQASVSPRLPASSDNRQARQRKREKKQQMESGSQTSTRRASFEPPGASGGY